MSDRWVLAHDPREGEIEDAEWCSEHGQRRESCGPCWDAERAAVRELTTEELLGAALVAMLERIQERDDETKGAYLAARFEKASE